MTVHFLSALYALSVALGWAVLTGFAFRWLARGVVIPDAHLVGSGDDPRG